MDKEAYLKKQEVMCAENEALCLRCGSCCGIGDSDPCQNLVKLNDGKYICSVYERRLGQQKTVSGKIFKCVSIRDLRKCNKLYSLCPYL